MTNHLHMSSLKKTYKTHVPLNPVTPEKEVPKETVEEALPVAAEEPPKKSKKSKGE